MSLPGPKRLSPTTSQAHPRIPLRPRPPVSPVPAHWAPRVPIAPTPSSTPADDTPSHFKSHHHPKPPPNGHPLRLRCAAPDGPLIAVGTAGTDRSGEAEGAAAGAIMVAAGEQAPRRALAVRKERVCTAKERISRMPPCAAGKRSSIYRGVTRFVATVAGNEAISRLVYLSSLDSVDHRGNDLDRTDLADSSIGIGGQVDMRLTSGTKALGIKIKTKRGNKVCAYDDEEAAARAYDLAALKYWGAGTQINFPVTDYARDLEEMQMISKEDYLVSLRRKSSAFSRGLPKYRGLPRISHWCALSCRQLHNSRWDTSLGHLLGNDYMNLSCGKEIMLDGKFAGGFGLERKIDLTNYIRWWLPKKTRQSDTSKTEEIADEFAKNEVISSDPFQSKE
nr:unnamed protein product [Digitaria exilis]